jgi:YQGE family putative transporter
LTCLLGTSISLKSLQLTQKIQYQRLIPGGSIAKENPEGGGGGPPFGLFFKDIGVCITWRRGGMGVLKAIGNLKENIRSSLGIDFLPPSFVSFFFVHLGFLVTTNAINPSVNMLFFRLTGKPDAVLSFHLIVFALTPIGSILSIFFLKRRTFTMSIRISLYLFVLLYVVFLCILRFQNMLLLPFVAIVAILTAFGNGFYWVTYSFFIIQHVDDEKRDKAMALIGVASGCVSVVAPLLSGVIISTFNSLWGYAVVVSFSIIVAAITLIHSNKLSSDYDLKVQANFKKAFALAFKNEVWVDCSLCDLFKGIREGLFTFYPSLLLYAIVRKEGEVSFNIFVIGILTIISSSLYGKTKEDYDLKLMAIAINILTVVSALMFINYSKVTVIILGFVNAFFNLYILNPTLKVFYNLVSSDVNNQLMMPELYAVRNCFSGVGRVLGVVLVVWLSGFNKGVPASILIITVLQYGTLYFCRKTTSLLKKGEVQ